MMLSATLTRITCFTLTGLEYPTAVTRKSETSGTGLALVGAREFKRLSDAADEEDDDVLVEGQDEEPAKLDTKVS